LFCINSIIYLVPFLVLVVQNRNIDCKNVLDLQ
jgi:hypothetical protein